MAKETPEEKVIGEMHNFSLEILQKSLNSGQHNEPDLSGTIISSSGEVVEAPQATITNNDNKEE